jgi:hypothetical protein
MKITYETTLAEAAEAPLRFFLRGKTYTTNRWRGTLICAGAFGFFGLLGFNAKPNVNLPVICVAAAAWGAGIFLLAYKSMVRRRITTYVASELKGTWPRRTDYTVNGAQLICTGAGQTFTYRRAELTEVHDDGRWLELSFVERGLCVIPLRAFADTNEKVRFLTVLGEPSVSQSKD